MSRKLRFGYIASSWVLSTLCRTFNGSKVRHVQRVLLF